MSDFWLVYLYFVAPLLLLCVAAIILLHRNTIPWQVLLKELRVAWRNREHYVCIMLVTNNLFFSGLTMAVLGLATAALTLMAAVLTQSPLLCAFMLFALEMGRTLFGKPSEFIPIWIRPLC